MSLVRNTLVQASLTLGSRVLGFARDLALNHRFGQGPLMDAFTTALMFPNLFRRLFAEGAFAAAFVPVYGKARVEAGEEAAARQASEAMTFVCFAVAGFSIAAQIAMPLLMPILLSAYAEDPAMMRIATLLTQLAMPYLACMTLASLLSGVLNTHKKFALAAGAPILLNICTLATLLAFSEPRAAVIATAAAVSLAGVLQAGLLWWAVARLGVRLRLGLPKLTATVKTTLALAVPGALSGGAFQLNSLVSQLLTGADEGARSVLYNADRLYQLPLGLVGVAIGLALVPRLTRFYALDDQSAAREAMDSGIGLAMALTMPAALALLVMPFFIIDATVTRGAFTSADAARTAEVLRHFAWGVPAFVLVKVLTPPYFARQDTKSPMRFALATVGISTVAGALLFLLLPRLGVDGVVGLAIATSATAWINVGLLARGLAQRGVYVLGAAVWGRLSRIGLASLVMAGAIGAAAFAYQTHRAEIAAITFAKEGAILAAALGGMLIYALAALLLRAVRPGELRSALRREAGAPGVRGDSEF
jgi:putative peptidoglycan lipid II flippase